MPDTTPDPSSLKFKRVLLKLSGEALMGPKEYGIDTKTCEKFAREIMDAKKIGSEICVVIGGGNIFRGFKGSSEGMDRAHADSIGMLATVMNALAMQAALEALGQDTRVQSAVHMEAICEPFIRRRAIRHMEKGRVVLFAAGTGHPFFTTDTGAALRAAEMGCDAMLKGTQVDGVYTADPKTNPDATRYESISYQDVLRDNLKVLDASAVDLMRGRNIPIVIFNMHHAGMLNNVLLGQGTSTIIQNIC